MNPHALRVLEFDRVMRRVAERASSELGRAAVLELRPCPDPVAARRELARVEEAMRFLGERPQWIPPEIPDARAGLRRLEVDGAVLEAGELHDLGRLLASGRALLEALDGAEEEAPLLVERLAGLHEDPDREEAVERTVDRDGNVLDEASRELKRIRGELRRAHSRIVQKLERYLRTLPERFVVGDASVTIRNGRYVVPVRREGKGEVGGIVHDESATGATLFVEPPLAIQLMNELKTLERDEAREVHRILTEHTAALRPRRVELRASQNALVAFDSLWARARIAGDWRGTPPELLPVGSDELEIVGGRHPLLLGGEEPVVPFDLRLEPGERALVVSGPNTGGKSVFLKAMGLISALTQSGVVPPARAGSRLPVFTGIFADIGDEQSIAESLSTFSAHLANLKEIVEEAGPGSLVLIDEMGTGTDPAEGAALARAILETLVERRALSVVTSHLGALKRLDADGSGIVNASLQFDPDRMEPTYALTKGRPGRSYGLAIARRLGFPGTVLDRAESHVSAGEASVEDLLEKLEREEKVARELRESLAREEAEVQRLRAELEAREEELRQQERTAERRAREEARRLLMEAREEVEEAIREVREAGAAGELDEASRRARRKVEEAARRQKEETPDVPEPEPVGGGPVAAGDRVRVGGSGTTGIVLEVRDGRAVLEASGLRMQVPVQDLVRVAKAAEVEAEAGRRSEETPAWTGPAGDASTEVDLRGLRVDEVEFELGKALDRAVLSDLPELRIIHGKGTGALRARVEELLRRDGRVAEFRLGQRGEGGAGVTVATFR